MRPLALNFHPRPAIFLFFFFLTFFEKVSNGGEKVSADSRERARFIVGKEEIYFILPKGAFLTAGAAAAFAATERKSVSAARGRSVCTLAARV